jgi:hypothetical protein
MVTETQPIRSIDQPRDNDMDPPRVSARTSDSEFHQEPMVNQPRQQSCCEIKKPTPFSGEILL